MKKILIIFVIIIISAIIFRLIENTILAIVRGLL